MKLKHNEYINLLLLILFWPTLHVIIFFLRFGDITLSILSEIGYFIPYSVLAALLFMYYVKKIDKGKTRYLLMGYFIASPFAFFGSLAGGLIFDPVIGVTLFGFIPLAIGMSLAYLIIRPKTSKT